MAGTFLRRTQKLLDDVGGGKLMGRVTVNQPYAQDQHESLHYKHPGGGQPKYLEQPLMNKHRRYLQRLADAALRGNLEDQMAKNMEDLSTEVFKRAPFEFGDLRASGHPEVISAGKKVYDRQPNTRRLIEADLDAKDDLRALGLGHNF